MKRLMMIALICASVTPAALAQDSIRGVPLSPEDVGRVQRQCDALQAQQMRSLAAETPEPPEAGEIVSDAAGFWADRATGMDEALSHINLGSITLRDCRAAGFR